MKSNGSIYHLANMIGSKHTQAGPNGGPYYRAVPSPFRGGIICRVRGAISVLAGSAYATAWPKRGELEGALDK